MDAGSRKEWTVQQRPEAPGPMRSGRRLQLRSGFCRAGFGEREYEASPSCPAIARTAGDGQSPVTALARRLRRSSRIGRASGGELTPVRARDRLAAGCHHSARSHGLHGTKKSVQVRIRARSECLVLHGSADLICPRVPIQSAGPDRQGSRNGFPPRFVPSCVPVAGTRRFDLTGTELWKSSPCGRIPRTTKPSIHRSKGKRLL